MFRLYAVETSGTFCLYEVQALRLEMKRYTEQIAKLNEEFTKMKKGVEAVLKELDYTCCFLTDITSKNLIN